MSCVLRIYGDDFDVDRFMAETGLAYIAIHRKGEPVFKGKPDGKKIERNGVNIALSDAGFEDHQTQVTETIAYLNQYKENLMLLKSTPAIDSPTIDFGVEYPDNTHFCRSFDLPPALISLCGELGLGIELSVYREADKSGKP